MFKKISPVWFITIISFFIGIQAVSDVFFSTHNIDIINIKSLLHAFHVDWAFSDTLSSTNGINYFTGFFEALLFIGAIVYITSKQRQFTLIRFVFSIVFFSNILSIAYSALFYLTLKSFDVINGKEIILTLVYNTLRVLWIYVSYQIIQYFNTQTQLQIEAGADGQTYFVAASAWRRFVHPIIDSIVALMVFSPLVEFVAFRIFHARYNRIDWSNHMVLLTITVRILYYLFYESVLGITPAKLLTRTRVINDMGEKPAFKNILIRTVSRLMPLEAFSFFVSDGWHDKWSGTTVVKESTDIQGIDVQRF